MVGLDGIGWYPGEVKYREPYDAKKLDDHHDDGHDDDDSINVNHLFQPCDVIFGERASVPGDSGIRFTLLADGSCNILISVDSDSDMNT